MATMPHQLLKLLLLLLLLAVNLPSCWSLCDISTARRDAQSGSDGYQKVNPKARMPRMIARRAAKGAHVNLQEVEEAYCMNGHRSQTCLLFSAWSKDCVAHLMYCVASSTSFGRHNVDVVCYPVYLVEMSVKSGGEVYLSRKTNTPVVSEASRVKNAGKQLMFVSCRVWHNVSSDIRDSQDRFCVSIIDPTRPAWFVRHYAYFLHLEPEFGPRNPHIFDEDASFILIPNQFSPEFFALESVNYPDHYVHATDDGRLRISQYEDTREFRDTASFALTDHFVRQNSPCSSCKEIHDLNYMYAPSGEYSIKTSAGVIMDKVYCEMGLNGGGYTFLNPKDLPSLTNDEVQAIFTDKNSFLMRVRRSDNTQPYGLLKQLPQYQDIPLKLGLNEYSNYTKPQNLDFLGPNFIYYGFIPASLAQNNNQQGLQINGQNLTFVNCDANPNSYKALFPNFAERAPTTYLASSAFDLCDDIRSALSLNPSTRVMPGDYFMFAEWHWGGCGCYTQTDGRPSIGTILNVAIGFR